MPFLSLRSSACYFTRRHIIVTGIPKLPRPWTFGTTRMVSHTIRPAARVAGQREDVWQVLVSKMLITLVLPGTGL
jgi:hypothetical protein